MKRSSSFRPPSQVNIPAQISRHYEHPIFTGPSTGRVFISGDSSATQNWLTNTIDFKKVLFTKPVRIVTDTVTSADGTGAVHIHTTPDTIIKFDNCQFYDTGTTSALHTFDWNTNAMPGTLNSAVTGITWYDTNGQLITTRDGLIQFYGKNVKPLTAKEKLRQRIREQLAPTIIRSRALNRSASFDGVGQNEIIALQLLRKMVSHDVFKKYLKYGFVTVRGPSGVEYQIRRREHVIFAWKDGKKIAGLCVYLEDTTIPPTDEVVAKMLICECDEKDIWKRANVTWHANLPDIKKQLSLAA